MSFASTINTCRLTAFILLAGLFILDVPFCSGQVLNEELKLVANDGMAGDLFGNSIAIELGVVAVGSPRDDDNGSNSGSAYLLDASTGQQLHKLIALDGTAAAEFGNTIAIENGVIAVGAPDDNGNGNGSGSAYLFDAGTGQQLHKLRASDGAAGDGFGSSIALANGVVAVGSPYDDDNGIDSGSAYLFDGATGQQLQKLLASDGELGDFFGSSIAIGNGIVAVGAKRDDNENGLLAGSAYLFDASEGKQLRRILASDGDIGDFFGNSIDMDNGVVAVGSPYDVDPSRQSIGSAYLFDTITGGQLHKLIPGDGAAQLFGSSIAIANGIVAVGAEFDNDNGKSAGSAYLFNADTGSQLYKLLPSDGTENEFFGYSIAMDNGVVAVGAAGDNDNGTYSGSAYLFDANTGKVVVANQYTVYRGRVIGGNLSDSFESDDCYLTFNPGLIVNSSEAPVWLIFDASLPSDGPTGLEIVMESNAGTPGLTSTLEAWNWISMAYEVVDVSVASFGSDTIVNVDLSSQISDYVQAESAAVRTRVGWRKTGITINFPWEIRLDQLVWIVE